MSPPDVTCLRHPGVLRFLLCLALAGAVLLAYLQVKDFEFVTCDDDMYVYDNPMVRVGLSRAGVKWAFSAFHAANWHPLTWLCHQWDCHLFGLKPGGHHLTNLAFHIANTLLLFLFLARFTQDVWPSALVAALFALHPMHVESVAWVAERKDVLSTCLWLATMWAYAWYVTAPSLKRYLPILLLFALGLMAKPMLVTLPFVLLLLDWWPLNRIPSARPDYGRKRRQKPDPRPGRQRYWPLLVEKLPLLALTAASCLITLMAQKAGGAVMSLAGLPLTERLANALVSYVKYIIKMFWPWPMAFFYPLTPNPWWQALGAAVILAASSAVVIHEARRRPYLSVGWLWFLGTLVPVIGLVQVGGQAMADRYTYVPYIGLFIMLAWGAKEAAAWKPRLKTALAAGGVTLLAACVYTTWLQAGYWQNSETLCRHALEVTEKNYMAYNHLGMALNLQGRYAQAGEMFKKTIEISPNYSHAYNNLAISYAYRGKLDEAVELFHTAIRINPHQAVFYFNLAEAYRQQGKMAEAGAALSQAKKLAR